VHRLDVSKTGFLAPDLAALEQIADELGTQVDIVVDACQARLDRARVAAYVARGWMVMVTGSKFFTGPPFCGALLLPASHLARMRAANLPVGLADYTTRSEWPEGHGAQVLSSGHNVGLILRWHAALAEMAAFGALDRADVRARLATFLGEVEAMIARAPFLDLLEAPALVRPPLADSWDELPSILSFVVGTREAGTFVPLGLEDTRRLYRWLNTDLSAVIGGADAACAGLLCHIGQPVPVAHKALAGQPAGALRISAGARLVSGEPSHEGMDQKARLARETSDAARVIAKIGLIVGHFDALRLADPRQSYAPRHRPLHSHGDTHEP
jgi:hypothetical protein